MVGPFGFGGSIFTPGNTAPSHIVDDKAASFAGSPDQERTQQQGQTVVQVTMLCDLAESMVSRYLWWEMMPVELMTRPRRRITM